MKIELGLLRTKVARRILFLFLLSAVLPVSVLFTFSYLSVRHRLLDSATLQLTETAKNASNSLVERFQFLEERARLISVSDVAGEAASSNLSRSVSDTLQGPAGFFGATLVGAETGPVHLFGATAAIPELTQEELDHLAAGAGVAKIRTDLTETVGVFLGLATDGGGVLWVQIDPQFLWRTAVSYASLAQGAGLCVLYQGSEPLYCTVSDVQGLVASYRTRREEGEPTRHRETSFSFEWADPFGEIHLAVGRDVFLRPQFVLSGLETIVVEPQRTALSGLVGFRSLFWKVALMGVVFVALLSNVQIRRSLDPLAELKRGTDRLADGDLETRVSISSNDEFQELAGSFNHMSAELEAQFQALATIGEIDRAVLSALDSDEIIRTAMERTGDLISCDRVAACRLDWLGSREGKLQVFEVATGTKGKPRRVMLSAEDLDLLSGSDGFRTFTGPEAAQYFGEASGPGTVSEAILIPLRQSEGLSGFFAVGREASEPFSNGESERVQQVGEQISVALANAWLLEELERMSWGALTALARTIDAKSPWTSGHSEQVANLSVAIGRRLGLPQTTLTALQRGGLVHDIGKIAVPGSILDKKGKLTPEERTIIESHPEEGVRILEPVPGMDDILPMVLYHHEAWDGSGYPVGLAGDAIPLEARIMAVADQFDALSADRPYRGGLSREATTDFIKGQAGTGLDPAIVEVFLELLLSDELPLPTRPHSETVS
jgi:putative nucleotidyltransferase with HDIG domain